MAEKNNEKMKLSYDPNLLGYAQVAQEYMKQPKGKGAPIAKKALEMILQEIGADYPWLIGTINDEKTGFGTTRSMIENQLGDYLNYKHKQTVGDLIKYHGKTLDEYVDGGTKRVQDELKEFTGKKYGDIQREIKKAERIIEDKKDGEDVSDEDLENAQNTIEKYQKVLSTIEMPYQKTLSGFRNRVEDEVMREAYLAMYPPKDKKEKKE